MALQRVVCPTGLRCIWPRPGAGPCACVWVAGPACVSGLGWGCLLVWLPGWAGWVEACGWVWVCACLCLSLGPPASPAVSASLSVSPPLCSSASLPVCLWLSYSSLCTPWRNPCHTAFEHAEPLLPSAIRKNAKHGLHITFMSCLIMPSTSHGHVIALAATASSASHLEIPEGWKSRWGQRRLGRWRRARCLLRLAAAHAARSGSLSRGLQHIQ